MTFRHRAGVRPYTSSRDFAKPCVFDKQSPGPIRCAPRSRGGPLSLSYRAILPSSLAMVHSSTSGYSPRPPVSVCGTGARTLVARGFSRGPLRQLSARPKPCGTVAFRRRASFSPPHVPTRFNPVFRHRACLSLPRRPIACAGGMGMLTHLPSAAPFGCALGPD